MKPATSNYEFSLKPQNVAHVDTEHRVIKTQIPHPEDIKIFEKIMGLESSLIEKQLPIVWDHAHDYSIYDRWGNKWIDLSSTIFVANSGHANFRVKSRLKDTLDKGLLHSYCYPTVERAEFLEKIIEITPQYFERACLVSTGTEASERAIKLARLHGMKFNPRKKVIIGGLGNYHGKTMGAMMAAVTPEARTWIGNQDPDMHQMPFPYPWVLEKDKVTGEELFELHINNLLSQGIHSEEVTAFIIESYQGWGAIFYPVDYIQAMRDWSEKQNSLLIVDEIQSGFGRTGKLFGYEYYGIEPDLIICGKGISGSLPLSAVLGRGNLIKLDPTLTSTHGGHPMSCAAALGNLESLVEDKLVERADALGKKLFEWLNDWKNKFPDRIPLILGHGMVWAVFICKPNSKDLDADFTDKLVEKAMQRGVFSIRTGCGTIKFGAPLTISEGALKEAIDVYKESMLELIEDCG
jgi:4-aminobutyrate aminotransferase / (S)-3-amino-2-methylpropionate transaminase / 5-aminovalerate transaminase